MTTYEEMLSLSIVIYVFRCHKVSQLSSLSLLFSVFYLKGTMGWPIKLPLNTSTSQRPEHIQPIMIRTGLTVWMEGSPNRDLTMCRVLLPLMITLFIFYSSFKIHDFSLVFFSASMRRLAVFFYTRTIENLG